MTFCQYMVNGYTVRESNSAIFIFGSLLKEQTLSYKNRPFLKGLIFPST